MEMCGLWNAASPVLYKAGLDCLASKSYKVEPGGLIEAEKRLAKKMQEKTSKS